MALSYSNIVQPTSATQYNQTVNPLTLLKPKSNIGAGLQIAPLSAGGQVSKPAVNTPQPVAQPTQNTQTSTAPTATNYSTGGYAGGIVNPQLNTGAYSGGYTPPASTGTTYGGLVGSLVTNAQNTAALTQMTPEEQRLRQRAASLEGERSSALANVPTHGWDTAFQGGQEGVINRNINAQEGAVQAGITAAEQGRNVNATALTSAGTQLGTAISASQPSVTGYGQTSFNPLTGQFGGGSAGVQPGDPFYQTLQTYAQQLAHNQPASIPSTITGNPVLQAQLLQMAQQINPNFNYNTAQGVAGAQQSNAQLGGTAVTGANANVYQSALPAYYQMQSQLQNVEGLGNMLLQTASGGSINPFDVRFANQTLAQFEQQLSSPERTRFQETLNNFQGAASTLLANSSGQIPTDVSNSINSLNTGSLSMGALKALVDQAQKNGAIKLQSQAGIVNTSLQTLQQGTGTGAPQPTNTGGNTSTAGGYSFVLQNGKWVPA